MECKSCKKLNNIDSNFCSRCGFTFKKKEKCPICLENKDNVILICGHKVCLECGQKSYNIKKECPICRTKLHQCENCNSFRVLKNQEKIECLDCHKIKKLAPKKNKKILCIDCKSSRVLYNHVNENWSCMDCFIHFSIKEDIASLDNTPVTTTRICNLCCSNDIEYGEETKCLNCEQTNIKLLHITLEEYSRLRIKSKAEVAKSLEKKYCCVVCDSEKICKIVNLNDPLEETYFCKNCNKSDLGIKLIV